MHPAETIVLDANILIRAVLGRRVRQLIDTYAGQAVWTEDADFFGAGVAVWTINRIGIFLKEQAKSPEPQEE